jgi:hypothetical protein
MDENRRCYALLRRYLRERGEDVPLVIQANKQDHAEAIAPETLAAALRAPKSCLVVGAVAHRDHGVRETFNLAAKAALRAVQVRVSEKGLAAIAGTPDTADGLFDAILTMEDQFDGADPGEEEPTEEEYDEVEVA